MPTTHGIRSRPRPPPLLSCNFKRSPVRVETHDLGLWDGLLEEHRERPGAAAYIEYPVPRSHIGLSHEQRFELLLFERNGEHGVEVARQRVEAKCRNVVAGAFLHVYSVMRPRNGRRRCLMTINTKAAPLRLGRIARGSAPGA